MRLFWRKKKKERFNQKLIHAAKIHHLIYQSKIVITFGVIRSAVIGFAVIHEVVINRRLSSRRVAVIGFAVIHEVVINRRLSSRRVAVIGFAVIHEVVLVNNSVDMCEFHFRRKASYAVYF